MLPLVVLVGVVLAAPPALALGSIAVGLAATLVQAIGLVRWPFVVPELARRYVSAVGAEAGSTSANVELLFVALHRLLGVAIGEHLGYLLTGAWTLLVTGSILSTTMVPAWLGVVGVPIGLSLMVASSSTRRSFSRSISPRSTRCP